MALDGFEDVARLGTGELRHLLRVGTPEEQVWAAWALGLRLAEQAEPDLLVTLRHGDHSGVRRHVVVMLAGLGERSVLATLARHEPDTAVRATAAQYLLQTSTAHEWPHLRPLIAVLAGDPSPTVRRALLIGNQAHQILIDDDLAVLVADPDEDVRELAMETLIRMTSPNRLFPGILEEHILVEPNSRLVQRCLDLAIATGRAKRLVEMAVDAPPWLKVKLLRTLVKHGQRFSWDELAPIATQDHPEISDYLEFLMDDQS